MKTNKLSVKTAAASVARVTITTRAHVVRLMSIHEFTHLHHVLLQKQMLLLAYILVMYEFLPCRLHTFTACPWYKSDTVLVA